METNLLQHFNDEKQLTNSQWYECDIIIILRSIISIQINKFITCFCIVFKKNDQYELMIINDITYYYDDKYDLYLFLIGRIIKLNTDNKIFNFSKYHSIADLIEPIYQIIQSEIIKWNNYMADIKFCMICENNIIHIGYEIFKKNYCTITEKNIAPNHNKIYASINNNWFLEPMQPNRNKYFITIPSLKKKYNKKKLFKSIKNQFPYSHIYKSFFDVYL